MRDNLEQMLFGVPGRKLLNIKFFRGAAQDISEAEFRSAAANIVFNIQNEIGNVSETFGDGDCKILDVRKVVAALG